MVVDHELVSRQAVQRQHSIELVVLPGLVILHRSVNHRNSVLVRKVLDIISQVSSSSLFAFIFKLPSVLKNVMGMGYRRDLDSSRRPGRDSLLD